jgi:hypothetical protein
MFRRIEDNFSGAAAFIPISEGIAVAVELSLTELLNLRNDRVLHSMH